MQLNILGTVGTYPALGKACAGFLVVEGETRLLLDCGLGVLANLQAHTEIKYLAGILITHMHPDHFLDLMLMRYALTYGEHRRPDPLPVYLPPGGHDIWERMVAPIDETGGSFSACFVFSEYREGQEYRLRSLTAQVARLNHYVPNYGIKVSNKGTLVYSGDTAPCPQLLSLARHADLFVCEATSLDAGSPSNKRGHLTAEEAGTIARQAGVRRLLLTHIAPGADARKSLESARAAFNGEVLLAEEGQTYTINGG